MKIYLHDFIGNHSGVKYYLNTFAKKIIESKIDVSIISNYDSNYGKIYYPNFFKGNLFKKILLLCLAYFKLIYSFNNLKNNELAIISLYGSYVDLIILLISSFFETKVLLDVHEVVENDSTSKLQFSLFKFFFRNSNNKIIYHSSKSLETLNTFHCKNELLYVPHIKYELDHNYKMCNVDETITRSIKNNCLNFLFFGNIIPSKGIYDLLATIEIIVNYNYDVNFIIAGNDSKNCVSSYSNLEKIKRKSNIILRYINDDEMKFLYDNVDFILLPYINITQSGVLEMAINFKKPIISSNISYFVKIFDDFKTFGESVNTCNHEIFAKKINDIVINKKNNFFSEDDINQYYNIKDYDILITNLKKILT